ncbi:unnamed protein product [Parnassius apollo]|uniref:(apollo) hypothetical protein n=1 Tax=Parnassius apollo TaxID=110799 RepID=A0A8S3Y7D5_PARAO|nr:unnamed protein product [Parnassius apollo]
MVTIVRETNIPHSASEYRCADMLLHGGEAARGPVQRRRSGLLRVQCSLGAREGAGRAARRPRPPACMLRLFLTVKMTQVTAMPKARCSRAPPPWLEDDTP